MFPVCGGDGISAVPWGFVVTLLPYIRVYDYTFHSAEYKRGSPLEELAKTGGLSVVTLAGAVCAAAGKPEFRGALCLSPERACELVGVGVHNWSVRTSRGDDDGRCWYL